MDFTKTIINAVKIWVNKQLSFIENKIADLENRPSAFIQPEEPSETPDGTLWIDIDEESSDIIKIEIDSELNETSENPVQNKIINAAINNLNNLVGDTSVAEQITDNIDITLTQSGMAADAKAVGDAINNIPSPLPEVTADNNGDVLTVVDGEWSVGNIEVPVNSVNGMTGDVNIEIPEIPETLPNPNALTFTGAINATYDGSSVVAVEIPEQVQSDWNQNDPSQPDYVKNRTHYEEGSGATIEWDGKGGEDTGALYVNYDMIETFVSDKIPRHEELLGAEYVVTITPMYERPEEYHIEITEDMFYNRSDCICISDDDGYHSSIVIAKIDNAVTVDVYGNTYTFPKAGTYFGKQPGSSYVSKLTYGSTTIKTLDEKFIPDTIARVKDIPEQKTITVNGIEPDENGNIEIEVGSGSGGGVFSWNDLTDKPFYEEGGIEVILDNQSVTGSIIDGTSTMHYTMNFGLNLVIGETYTANINGIEFTSTAFESDEEQGAVCIGNPDLLTSLVYPDGEGFALMTSMKANITAFVLRDEGTETATISIYKDSMVVHTLDEKFIPDTIARISDIPNSFSGSYDDLTDKPELFSGSWNDLTDRPIVTTSGEITWNGNTADRDAFSFGGLSYYKIADIPSGKLALTSSTASNGAVLKPGDFSWGTIQHGGAVLYKGNYVFIVESTKIYVSEDDVTEVPSPGIYFGLITYNGQTSYTQAVTYETESIDEKFIPDTIARKSDIPEISDAVIAPTTAQVGQTIVVKAVDENGKPTEWEAVDPFVLTDESSGVKYKLSVVSGKLTMTEVTA